MCANRLTEYLETGIVRFRRTKKFYELNGSIRKTMEDYLTSRRETGICRETVDEISRAFLQKFLYYLTDNEINDVQEIDRRILIDYTVFCTGFQTQYIRHRMLGILKGYLRYLHDIGRVFDDFSKTLPKDKYLTVDGMKVLLAEPDQAIRSGRRDLAL